MQDDCSFQKITPIQASSPCLFILMGASNLARGFQALTDCLVDSLAPNPVEVLHALGPGRGYCAEGGIFNIRYPSIGSSEILKSASARRENFHRVIALITDIGNDIMYGVPESEITACLRVLLEKLDAIDANVFVHSIPLDFSKDVSKSQFRLLKSIFYPHSQVDYLKAKEAVCVVNEFLRDHSGGRVHLLPSAKDFMGVDKIHYSVFHSHKAWGLVAHEMLRVLDAPRFKKIGWRSSVSSLIANMGRLVFYDMMAVKKKSPQTF